MSKLRYISFTLIFAVLFSATALAADDFYWSQAVPVYVENTDNGVFVVVDGSYLHAAAGEEPFIESGRTMMPLRAIAQAFGFEIDWNSDEQKITLTQTVSVGTSYNVIATELNPEVLAERNKLIAEQGEQQPERDLNYTVPEMTPEQILERAKMYLEAGLPLPDSYYEAAIEVGLISPDSMVNAVPELTQEEIREREEKVVSERQQHSKTIVLYIGSAEILIDGKISYFEDVVPMARNGRTFLPASKLAEILGITVEWNGDARTAIFTSN